MKIYISGPITGYDFEGRRAAFELVRQRVQQLNPGAEVVTPFDLGMPPSTPWRDAMGECLKLLMQCDGMVMMYGFSGSRGCRVEWLVGRELMEVQYEKKLRAFGQEGGDDEE